MYEPKSEKKGIAFPVHLSFPPEPNFSSVIMDEKAVGRIFAGSLEELPPSPPASSKVVHIYGADQENHERGDPLPAGGGREKDLVITLCIHYI